MAMADGVFDAVRTVLAIREYRDRKVGDDLIDRIVEAGRLTASSMNRQPWHFVVVRDRDHLRELGTLVASGPYIAQASFAVVAAYETDSIFGVSDLSRAIQSMVLTAWDEGVGSNWTGPSVSILLGTPLLLQLHTLRAHQGAHDDHGDLSDATDFRRPAAA
jgi:nitroreductase